MHRQNYMSQKEIYAKFDYYYHSGSWQNPARFDVSGLQYDKNGNILGLIRRKETNATIDQLTYSYQSGSNRLQSVTDAVNTTPEDWDAEDSEFSYDGNGNVITMLENGQPAISAIAYDHRNLPTSLLNRNGDLVTYRYDAAGQRIFKKVGDSAAEHYLMDAEQNVAVFAESGSLKYWNVLANGVMGRRKASGEKLYYLKDHLGSTRAVIDNQATVVEAHDYYPFGLLMPGRSYLPGERTKELFTGKERDTETGLDYFGARYYWPAGGRWLAVDPLAEKYPSLSPYAFTANNPVNNLERDGRFFDILADVAFIAYDIYDIASTAISGEQVSGTQWAALGADVAGALIPGATGGGLSVRAAARLKKAEQVRKNYAKGKAAEKVAKEQLEKEGFEILGEQVSIKTSTGTRQSDFLVKKGEKETLVEVKSGSGKRTKAQKAKDKEIAEKGGELRTNKVEGKEKGETVKTETIELRIKDEELK